MVGSRVNGIAGIVRAAFGAADAVANAVVAVEDAAVQNDGSLGDTMVEVGTAAGTVKPVCNVGRVHRRDYRRVADRSKR
ncbi:MAG: hypothetical protein ACYTEQ_05810 [Planctomycetota bacterium]